jgi:hypothetical protein
MLIFRLYKKLPLICQLALHRRLIPIESEMLRAMNAAYSAKNAKYPVEHLINVTLLNSRMSLEKYAAARLIELDSSTDNSSILFSKANNQHVAAISKLTRESLFFVDKRLEELNEADFLLDTSFV